jgi:hypothetical protein
MSLKLVLADRAASEKPTVKKPTQAQSKMTKKHKAIFSLHACLVLLSLIPPIDERRNGGAQKVT